MLKLSEVQFLSKVDAYMSQINTKKVGGIDLTFKRINPEESRKTTKKNRDAEAKRGAAPIGSVSCLVRAKLGAQKISCVIAWEKMLDFQRQFGTIFRARTNALVTANNISDRLKKRRAASVKKI